MPKCSTLASRQPPRATLRRAIAKSLKKLDLSYAPCNFDGYLQGVTCGRQPLEDYTEVVHAAFAPLRNAFRVSKISHVRVFRGEPIKPLKIRRDFLSWSVNLELAAGFALHDGYHVVSALVPLDSIIGGYDYEAAGTELLIRERGTRRCVVGKVPKEIAVDYFGKEDRASKLAIALRGGLVLRSDWRAKKRNVDYWSGYPAKSWHGTLHVAGSVEQLARVATRLKAIDYGIWAPDAMQAWWTKARGK